MTVARRLAAIEGELDPTGRVLRWLAEAHQYDRFDAYIKATLTGGAEMPLDRLVRESADTARGRKLPGAEADKADRAEIRATVVRYFIALTIIEVTAHALEREAFIHAALTGYLLLAIERGERQPPPEMLPLSRLRDLLVGRVGELHALRDARGIVEQRFLGGQSALFPAARREWEQQFVQTDLIARMALRRSSSTAGSRWTGTPR